MKILKILTDLLATVLGHTIAVVFILGIIALIIGVIALMIYDFSLFFVLFLSIMYIKLFWIDDKSGRTCKW